jgi:thioesterase domain-containing protein
MEMYKRAYAKRFELEKLQFKECPRTRDLVARRFGLSVAEQLAAESYLRGLNTLQPLNAIHSHHFPRSTVDSWFQWVRGVSRVQLVVGKHPDLPIDSRYDNFGKEWWLRHGEQIFTKDGHHVGQSIFSFGNK